MRKKLIYSIFCCIAAAVMVVACTKEGENPAEVLSLDISSINLTSVGTTQPVLVSTTAAWSVNTSADWLTVTPASGVGNTTIVVAVLDNETVNARMAILTVTAGNKTNTITVSQSGMATTLPGEAGAITGLGTNDCPYTNTIELTAEPITGADSYVWYHNGTIIYNVTGLTCIATETGAYTYVGKNSLGLGSPGTEKRIVIDECPLPDQPEITGLDANVCPKVFTVELTIEEVANAVSYQWYRNGRAIVDATALAYTVSQTGTYTASAINAAGETLSAEKEVTIEECDPNYLVPLLVGTWSATGWLRNSSTNYAVNRNILISAVAGDPSSVFIQDIGGLHSVIGASGMDNAIVKVNSALMTFIMPTTELPVAIFTDSDGSRIAPLISGTYCDNNGLSLTIPITEIAGGLHRAVLNSGYNTVSISGSARPSSTVYLATVGGVCSGGGLIGYGAVWTQVNNIAPSPSPMVPESIRRMEIPMFTEAE